MSARPMAATAIAIATMLVIMVPSAQAIRGKLKSPAGIAFLETYPEHARRQVREALQQEGCAFVDGHFINSISTLHFRGNTAALNKSAGMLAECPGATVHVSFQKMDVMMDWRVIHDADSNAFRIIVNLNSKNVQLEELAIPAARGPGLQALAPPGDDPVMAALQEVHDLCSERTRLRIRHRSGHPRLQEIEQRLADLYGGPLHDLQTVASEASLANAEEPQFGQPAYGIILHATAVDDIAADELLLFHADRVLRGQSFRKLLTNGEGWYFRSQVAIPQGTRFVVACIQDAPEEVENVKNGFMPNSDRARNPDRPYRTQIFRPDGTPLAPRR